MSVKNKLLEDKTVQLEDANKLAQVLITDKERQNALLKEQTVELEILAHRYREVLVVDLFSQAASGD